MKKVSRLLFLVILTWVFSSGQHLQADCRKTAILERANAALSEVAEMHFNRIMLTLLRNAQGVAIFPGLLKAAVGVGGRHGRGVLLIREADGSWGPPVFVTLSGASAGIQLGVEGSDLVIIFRTRSHLECLKRGKLALGLGNALAVGPIGVDKILATDVCLKTGIFSQSRCKGLFAGWCVEGASLRIDAAANAAYSQYEQGCLPNGGSAGPEIPAALRLQMKLAELSAIRP
jgi:lipid-binding SYLF domain-containing protein